jgi:glycosyltransferase involved in cell wall biosynthesis
VHQKAQSLAAQATQVTQVRPLRTTRPHAQPLTDDQFVLPILRAQVTRTSRSPTVSVCIAAYNAADTIGEVLDSVWSQTFDDFEVVVVDDSSTDATPALLARQTDPRLRVLRNPRNLGVAATWNRCLQHARGELIKFLESDDTFYPGCVASMMELIGERQSVGMVFCRRSLLFDPNNDYQRRWTELYGDVASRFGRLDAINHGPELFRRWFDVGFTFNCVGEPLVVMIRRDVFERAGGFNPHIRQRSDLDLWARATLFCDVGFVSDELGRYRVPSTNSLTIRNHRVNLDWLDELWTLEGLGCLPEARVVVPGLDRRRNAVRRQKAREFRELFRRKVPARGTRLADAARMGRWLGHRRVHPDATPFPGIGPPAEGSAPAQPLSKATAVRT